MPVQHFKTNLNCGGCVAAVKPYLDENPSIQRWSVNTGDPDKVLAVEGPEVSAEAVERDVARGGFAVLGRLERPQTAVPPTAPAGRGTLLLYHLPAAAPRPGLSAGRRGAGRVRGRFLRTDAGDARLHGRVFRRFLVFQLLDLRGFVDSFQTYDVVARPLRAYGYAYPFVELVLGIAYLLALAPVVTNLVTLVVMLVGIVGVSQALLRRRRIQCACLGTVFNLPMSKVTFIEDGLMAAMAAAMLAMLLV